MIRSPRYAGIFMHNGDEIGQGAWEPIIDWRTHERLLAVLADTANPNGGGNYAHLLSGIARCGKCGAPMVSTTSGRSNAPTYRCDRKTYGACGNVQRRQEIIERYVIERIMSEVNTDVVSAEVDVVQAELDSIETEITSIDLDVHLLQQPFGNGDIGAQDFYPVLTTFRKRQGALHKQWQEKVAQWQTATVASAATDTWESWTIDQRARSSRARCLRSRSTQRRRPDPERASSARVRS